jgi:hypothetical protein
MEFRKLFLFAPTYRGPDRELDGSIWGATNGREVTRGVKKFTGLIISVSVCGIKNCSQTEISWISLTCLGVPFGYLSLFVGNFFASVSSPLHTSPHKQPQAATTATTATLTAQKQCLDDAKEGKPKKTKPWKLDGI